MRDLIKDYLIISLGVVIVALGLSVFLIPANLAVGGVTGFAMVINNIFPHISVGSVMITMNVVLFIIAFILIGKQFGAKTIYASFALSGTIWLIEVIYPLNDVIVDNMILNLFYGILIQGIGMAVIFYQNASTGGTDIIAKIINKFFHIEIGKSLLFSDFLITLMAGLTFGLELGLFALLGVIMNAFIIDNIIEGLNLKIKLSIITICPEKIKEYITEELDGGATIDKGEGAVRGENREVLTKVINKKEFIRLKSYVKEVDEDAFVTASNIKEVLGNGFSYS